MTDKPTRSPARPVPARPSKNTKKRRPTKRQARRSAKPYVFGVLIAVVVAVVLVVVLRSGSSTTSSGPEGVPLEAGAALAPRGAVAPAQGLGFGVGCGSTEVLATHIHSHLAVYVNGQPRSIPYGVGMVGQLSVSKTPQGPFAAGASQCFYWLHTHASDGIIHIEAPAGRTFVLGQFFGVWGQPLTADQVGPAKGHVTAYVNGHRWTGALSEIPLRAHEAIQLDVGTPLVPPKPVHFPSSL
ncbi:MAG: hypothetical protein ACYC1D_00860 [Acidimicrobiales bacterium]